MGMPKMKTRRIFALLTAAFFLSPSIYHARGQTSSPPSHRRWEVSAFGGASTLGDHTFATPVLGDSSTTSRTVGLSYDTGYMAGARILESLSEFWGAEFEYSFANQPLQFTGLTPDMAALDLSHSVHRFDYSLVFFVADPYKRLRPFFTTGAGVSLFHVGGSSKSEAASLTGIDLKDRWHFTFNWGGGVKYLLRDHWAVRFDFRDMITGVPDYGFPSSAQVVQGQFTPGFAPSGIMHGLQYSLGIAYQWDGW